VTNALLQRVPLPTGKARSESVFRHRRRRKFFLSACPDLRRASAMRVNRVKSIGPRVFLADRQTCECTHDGWLECSARRRSANAPTIEGLRMAAALGCAQLCRRADQRTRHHTACQPLSGAHAAHRRAHSTRPRHPAIEGSLSRIRAALRPRPCAGLP
jgi:hypothetical protein